MTKEKAKEIADILLAFADGKTIQKKCYHGWQDLPILTSEHAKDALLAIKGEYMEYRVKPELKLVPFTFEDNKEFRDRWLKRKNCNSMQRIVGVYPEHVSREYYGERVKLVSYKELLRYYTFDDGSPCGKFIEI